MLNAIVGGMVLGFVASPTCPSNAEEIRLGTRYGFGIAVLVGLGAVAGDAAVLAAVLLGLLPLQQAQPVLSVILWLLGGAVLLYIAWGSFVEARTVADIPDRQAKIAAGQQAYSRTKAFWTGFAITTFNPFTGLWWLALLGPMVNSGNTVPVVFSAAVLVGSLAWFLPLAGALHLGRRWLGQRPRRWLLTISGLVVLGFGLYFLWQGGIGFLGLIE